MSLIYILSVFSRIVEAKVRVGFQQLYPARAAAFHVVLIRFTCYTYMIIFQ